MENTGTDVNENDPTWTAVENGNDGGNSVVDTDSGSGEDSDEDDGDEWSSLYEPENSGSPLAEYLQNIEQNNLATINHAGGHDATPSFVPSWLKDFLNLCCLRGNHVLNQSQMSGEELNVEEDENIGDGLLDQMRKILDEHADNVDWSHDTLICVVRYAAICKDIQWMRIFAEYGADITELDQGCLFDRVYSSMSTNSGDIQSDAESSSLAMVKYLLMVLDINVHYLQVKKPVLNPQHPRQIPDFSDSIHIRECGIFRMLLAHCGHIVQFATIHHYSSQRKEVPICTQFNGSASMHD